MSNLNGFLSFSFGILCYGTLTIVVKVIRRGMRGKKSEAKSDAEILFDMTPQ